MKFIEKKLVKVININDCEYYQQKVRIRKIF